MYRTQSEGPSWHVTYGVNLLATASLAVSTLLVLRGWTVTVMVSGFTSVDTSQAAARSQSLSMNTQ